MNVNPRGETLRLKSPSPAKAAAPPKPAPLPSRAGTSTRPVPAPPLPKAEGEKVRGSSYTPPQWLPGRTVDELCDQLEVLVDQAHPVFRLGVRPLALGTREGLREEPREGCKQRRDRWLAAWCRQPEYLAALVVEGAMRHDRHDVPVEPVEPENAEIARQRLAWLARRRGDAP